MKIQKEPQPPLRLNRSRRSLGDAQPLHCSVLILLIREETGAPWVQFILLSSPVFTDMFESPQYIQHLALQTIHTADGNDPQLRMRQGVKGRGLVQP